MWLQTSKTDNWTLEIQNERGKMGSADDIGRSIEEKYDDQRMDVK